LCPPKDVLPDSRAGGEDVMKFVIAMMKHETNTFSPLPTLLSSFGRTGGHDGPLYGPEVTEAYAGTNNPIAAFLDLAREEGAEVVTPIAAEAWPSGPVDDDAFEVIVDAICDSVALGCDALFLDLHGAMVTGRYDDPEGRLLRRVRTVAPDLPIAVAFDFHANLSTETIENATVITGYRTYPHVDMYDAGARAGRTLLRSLNGEITPVIAWGSLPLLTHMLCQTPSRQPMKDVMDMAIAAEADGRVLNASVFGGFPLADHPHVGVSTVVVGDGDAGAAAELSEALLDMAWERRAEFVYSLEPAEVSIAHAKTLDEGPVVLVEHGDNCGAGGNQDVMTAIEEVMRQGLVDVAVSPVWDPDSVAQMIDAGVGNEVTLNLGGKTDMPAINLKGEPLRISGRVRAITDGRFTVTGPMMTGMRISLGRTAVLDCGNVEIMVSEERMEPFDLGVFRHAGIEPTQKKYLLVKSRQHFRAAFEPIAKHIVEVAGPGVCSSDYDLFPFKNLRRPIYPLDPDATR